MLDKAANNPTGDVPNTPVTASSVPVPSRPVRLFDSGRILNVRIISGGVKTCKVRFPSDHEWCDRARRQKTVRKHIGRNKTVPVPQRNENENLRLFNLIRQADPEYVSGSVPGSVPGSASTPEFDAAEASLVIGQIDNNEVTEITREPDGYRVHLKAMNIPTIHYLKFPSASQALEYHRSSSIPMDDGSLRITRVVLEPSGVLYDRLMVSSEGYSPGSLVPITHKQAVVFELLRFIDEEINPSEDEFEGDEDLGINQEDPSSLEPGLGLGLGLSDPN